MTANRYAKGEPRATVSSPVDASLPKFCEIPGCKTRWVPPPIGSAGSGHHACGSANTVVNDRYGVRRGICADHYLQGLIAAGKHDRQHLVDEDGRYDVRKVRDHWDSIAQTELDQTKKLARRAERGA